MRGFLLLMLLQFISSNSSNYIQTNLNCGLKTYYNAVHAARDFVAKDPKLKRIVPVALYSSTEHQYYGFKVVIATQLNNTIHLEEILIENSTEVVNTTKFDNTPEEKISNDMYKTIQKVSEKYLKEHGLRMTTMNNVVVKREFYIVNVLVKNDKKKRALVINQNSIGKYVVMALFYLD